MRERKRRKREQERWRGCVKEEWEREREGGRETGEGAKPLKVKKSR